MSGTLQFRPLKSIVHQGFWGELSKRKLGEFKLDCNAVPLVGIASFKLTVGLPALLSLPYATFEDAASNNIAPYEVAIPGQLYNANTLQLFIDAIKVPLSTDELLLRLSGEELFSDSTLLASFSLYTFADLKQYHYSYIFCFPVLRPEAPIVLTQCVSDLSSRSSPAHFNTLDERYQEFVASYDIKQRFCCVLHDESSQFYTLSQFRANDITGRVTFCCCDFEASPSYPNWFVRNYILFVALHFKTRLAKVTGSGDANFICLRLDKTGNISPSLHFSIKLPDTDPTTLKISGWELNDVGKGSYKHVDMSRSMDPNQLAASAVTLNLKLMKWRLAPQLNLDKIASQRCLLVGSGTLGCNVGRCLLSWGVTTITFIDSGRVSYSNPVRQSLFTHEDCLNGGRWKADAAAERLALIYPLVTATATRITVPMPGHAISNAEAAKTEASYAELERLVREHDVVFLLTDSRESRWLPTVLAEMHGKLAITAALGFDTFLVSRHGGELGCYFCNDVVAPGDSLQDRTLDQQCTVTRPGLSYTAAALAVEIFASVCDHPDGRLAPAESSSTELGCVPHQLRGFFARFEQLSLTMAKFANCAACSPAIVETLRAEGYSFVRRVAADSSLIEHISGLEKLRTTAEEMELMGFSDDEF